MDQIPSFSLFSPALKDLAPAEWWNLLSNSSYGSTNEGEKAGRCYGHVTMDNCWSELQHDGPQVLVRDQFHDAKEWARTEVLWNVQLMSLWTDPPKDSIGIHTSRGRLHCCTIGNLSGLGLSKDQSSWHFQLLSPSIICVKFLHTCNFHSHL